ncbi:hypothetical protein P8452_34219 [Trifolium repens]|nr:hypothetical protein P8452_34219 [Trifolium repens]
MEHGVITLTPKFLANLAVEIVVTLRPINRRTMRAIVVEIKIIVMIPQVCEVVTMMYSIFIHSPQIAAITLSSSISDPNFHFTLTPILCDSIAFSN